jgi:hypothetical protein
MADAGSYKASWQRYRHRSVTNPRWSALRRSFGRSVADLSSGPVRSRSRPGPCRMAMGGAASEGRRTAYCERPELVARGVAVRPSAPASTSAWSSLTAADNGQRGHPPGVPATRPPGTWPSPAPPAMCGAGTLTRQARLVLGSRRTGRL